jgi:Pvc16 N-terminal domain
MSNYLAIATTTAALQQVLLTPVSNAVGSAVVGFNRPDAASSTTPLVNIFLYQITPNAAYRNADLPTRRSDGSLVQRPQAAFDLHYLFTFHGNDAQLEPQRLLGAVATTLHSQPLLSTDNINSAVTTFGFLAGSGLDSQIERIRFTPTALSLEEFSKLWSVFFQVEYSLSAAYQASVVLMESSDTPVPAKPVLQPNLYVVPFNTPYVSQIVAQDGKPITSASTILIQGTHLMNPNTFLLIEDQELTASASSATQLTLAIPATLHAGVKALQVLQKLDMGTPATTHRGFESNVAAFVLHPTVTSATAVADVSGGTDVTVNLAPNIGIGQRAVLLLDNVTATPPISYASQATVSVADASSIVINILNVPTGTYLVRVQIDGAESQLSFNSVTHLLEGPTVAMP